MSKMTCENCQTLMVKNGKTPMNVQRYLCKTCKQTRQEAYKYKACLADTNVRLVQLLKESCGTRSISRLLNISASTVTSRILSIASKINIPMLALGKSYQMDEMFTFIGCKKHRVCVAYAIDSKTKEVASFSAGNHPAYNTMVEKRINQYVLKNGESGLENYIKNDLIPELEDTIEIMQDFWKQKPTQDNNLNSQIKKILNF